MPEMPEVFTPVRDSQMFATMQNAHGRKNPIGAESPIFPGLDGPIMPNRPAQIQGSMIQANPSGALKTPGRQLSLHAALPTSPAEEPQSLTPPGISIQSYREPGQQGTLLWVPWVVPPGTESDLFRELAAKASPASVETLASCNLSRQSTVDSGLTMGWKSPPAYVGGVTTLSQQSTCESDDYDTSVERKVAEEKVEMPPGPPKHMQRNKFHKTRLCSFFEKGSCHKGSRCNFAHGDAELQPIPDLHCTKLCPRLIECGECDEEQCTFAHSNEELRTYNKELAQNRRVSFIDECAATATPDTPADVSEESAQHVDSNSGVDDDDSDSLNSDDDLEPEVNATSGWGRQCTEDPSLAAVRMLRVKNTFLDVEDDEQSAAPPLRRSNSAPCLMAFPLDERPRVASSKEQVKQEQAPQPDLVFASTPILKEPLRAPDVFCPVPLLEKFNAGEPAIIKASM